MKYNAAFFGAHEAYFLILKELEGEDFALKAMRRVMERNLGRAYSAMEFEKGSPHGFVRVVGERDKSVGLRVEFPHVSNRKVVYRFHTDPFPNLRGHVDPYKLDATYMKFKVDFLLGSKWKYDTASHLWLGAPYTEHVITRK